MTARDNYNKAMGDALEKLQRLIEMRQQGCRHKVEPRSRDQGLEIRALDEEEQEGIHFFEDGESLLDEYPDNEMDPEDRDAWLWMLKGVVQDLRRAQGYHDEELEGAEKAIRILARVQQAHTADLSPVEAFALDRLVDPHNLRCIGGNILLDEAAGIRS